MRSNWRIARALARAAFVVAVGLASAHVSGIAGPAVAATGEGIRAHVYTQGTLAGRSGAGAQVLRAKAVAQGTLRVMVELDFRMTNEDALRAAAAARQARGLSSAQNALV